MPRSATTTSRKLATAYGILTDKANVAAGRPTMISGRSPDERDAEIERLLQEEAAKRGASTQAEFDREVDELVEKLRRDEG